MITAVAMSSVIAIMKTYKLDILKSEKEVGFRLKYTLWMSYLTEHFGYKFMENSASFTNTIEHNFFEDRIVKLYGKSY